jgi:hypothetical protein
MAWTRKYYLKNNYLTLRSNTHIPNIIDLSGKTKKLWSRQALLRRSGRSGSGRRRKKSD